jgi:anti-sigma regulatory factor (Ser/Thr protein kinase)
MADEENALVCTSCTSELANIRSLVRKACDKFGLDKEKASQVVLAIDEACANVIRHGYNYSKHGYICIETYQEAGFGVFLIKDHCPQIDESVLAPKKKDLLSPGGLGLSLMHEVMDSVALKPNDDGGNHLELKVKL